MSVKCEDCNGAGWLDSYSLGRDGEFNGNCIEKCDTCNRFQSDIEAQDYVCLVGYLYEGDNHAN
jgi:hypothetical protein